jgi:hypothetical protein
VAWSEDLACTECTCVECGDGLAESVNADHEAGLCDDCLDGADEHEPQIEVAS